jgi:hypothetical protein
VQAQRYTIFNPPCFPSKIAPRPYIREAQNFWLFQNFNHVSNKTPTSNRNATSNRTPRRNNRKKKCILLCESFTCLVIFFLLIFVLNSHDLLKFFIQVWLFDFFWCWKQGNGTYNVFIFFFAGIAVFHLFTTPIVRRGYCSNRAPSERTIVI